METLYKFIGLGSKGLIGVGSGFAHNTDALGTEG